MAGCMHRAHPAITPPADGEQKLSSSFWPCAHSGRALLLKQNPGERGSCGHCISTYLSHKRGGTGLQIYPADCNLLSSRNGGGVGPSCKEGTNPSTSTKVPGYIWYMRQKQSSPFLSLPSSQVRINHGKLWELVGRVSSRWNFIWKKSTILTEYRQHYLVY